MALRYWRGGTGTWNTSSTTNWSATSGGAGGASVPTIADDVIFNNLSGTGTVTLTGALNCLSLNMTGSGIFTITNTGTINCSTNFTIVANTTWSATGVITFSGTGTTTTNGRTLACAILINAPGGTRTLGGSLTSTSTTAFSFNSGTLNLNNFNLTCSRFSSTAANLREIQFGTGSITCNGTGVSWNVTNPALFSHTGTPTVNISNPTATATTIVNATLGGSASTAFNFNINAGTYALTIDSGSVIRNLNFTGFGGTWAPTTSAYSIYGDVTLVSGMTFTTGTGTWTFALGLQQTLTSGGKTVGPITLSTPGTTLRLGSAFSQTTTATTTVVASTTININAQTNTFGTVSADFTSTFWTGGTIVVTGITQTGGTVAFPVSNLTYNNGPYNLAGGTLDLTPGSLTCTTFTSNNSNIRAITFGANKITTTGTGTVFSMSVVTNFSYTGSGLVEVNNNTATATNVQTSTSATVTQALSFNVINGTYSLSISGGYNSVDFTGFAGTLSSLTRNLFGNLTLSTGMTLTTGTQITSFVGTSGTQVITSNGRDITFPLNINTTGATVQLADNLLGTNTNSGLTFTQGTFNANGNNVTIYKALASGAGTKVITMGSGLWTISGVGSIWDMSPAGTTLNANTANIVLSNTTTSARTFGGGDKTYNKLTIGGSTGTSTLTINGSNTFSEIDSTKTVAHTIDFASSEINTIATWSITGTAGNVVSIESVNVGVISTLDIANTITLDYIRVVDVVKIGAGVVTLDDSQVLGQSDGWVIGPGTVYTPYIILTSGSGTVTLPSTWNPSDNTIYMIGGGGAGGGALAGPPNRSGGGGGGGAFTKLTNYPGAPLSNIAYSVGLGGPSNGANGTNTTFDSYVANRGAGASGFTAGLGGTAQTVSGIITLVYAGGNGGAGLSASSSPLGSGGGGGSAGPLGQGGNGASGTAASAGAGGGGGNGGGSNGSGQNGGNNASGVGGGLGGTTGASGTNGGGGGTSTGASGNVAGNGSTGTDIEGLTGSGGGSGGNTESPEGGSIRPVAGIGAGGGGGFFGGNGACEPGFGRSGVIAIFWTPTTPSGATGNFFLMF